MTDFELLLLREQQNPNAAILEFFISQYSSEDIVVLVEGPDDPVFYFDFVAAYLPNQSVFYFPCGGKRSLLKLREFLQSYGLKPRPKKILFFTDSDFDNYLGGGTVGVYATGFYSIENFFCNSRFFQYVVRKHCAG